MSLGFLYHSIGTIIRSGLRKEGEILSFLQLDNAITNNDSSMYFLISKYTITTRH